MSLFDWLKRDVPRTGTGQTPPAGTSLPPKVVVVFRDKSGKPIGRPKK